MSNLRLVETQKDTRIPILEPKNKAEAFKYVRRWAIGGIAIAAAGLTLGHEVRKGIDAVIFPQTISAKLAEPFNVDSALISDGSFAPGSVVEVSLPDSFASTDAAKLSGGDYYNSSETEIENDIVAEVGDYPGVGAKVFLDKSEVADLPAGSQIVK